MRVGSPPNGPARRALRRDPMGPRRDDVRDGDPRPLPARRARPPRRRAPGGRGAAGRDRAAAPPRAGRRGRRVPELRLACTPAVPCSAGTAATGCCTRPPPPQSPPRRHERPGSLAPYRRSDGDGGGGALQRRRGPLSGSTRRRHHHGRIARRADGGDGADVGAANTDYADDAEHEHDDQHDDVDDHVDSGSWDGIAPRHDDDRDADDHDPHADADDELPHEAGASSGEEEARRAQSGKAEADKAGAAATDPRVDLRLAVRERTDLPGPRLPVPDPAVAAPDLSGGRDPVRRAVGGARRDQPHRDELRPGPVGLQCRRRGLDAVPALQLGPVRDGRRRRRSQEPVRPGRRDLRRGALPRDRGGRPQPPGSGLLLQPLDGIRGLGAELRASDRERAGAARERTERRRPGLLPGPRPGELPRHLRRGQRGSHPDGVDRAGRGVRRYNSPRPSDRGGE